MMPCSSSIPESWQFEPLETLVIGEGPYARSLALVLRAGRISPEQILVGIEVPQEGGVPQVLGGLKSAVFIAGASQSAADILGCHAALWRWIERLSPEREQHELAILFILPPSAGHVPAESLAIGLGCEKFDPESGHAIARMGDSLESLCRALSAIRPCDLPPLRARQASNTRHKAIHQLIEAGSPNDFAQAARNVAECFRGQEYHLDLFCKPPSHRNGNQFRQWLRHTVTEGVTPDDLAKAMADLAKWLIEL